MQGDVKRASSQYARCDGQRHLLRHARQQTYLGRRDHAPARRNIRQTKFSCGRSVAVVDDGQGGGHGASRQCRQHSGEDGHGWVVGSQQRQDGRQFLAENITQDNTIRSQIAGIGVAAHLAGNSRELAGNGQPRITTKLHGYFLKGRHGVVPLSQVAQVCPQFKLDQQVVQRRHQAGVCRRG